MLLRLLLCCHYFCCDCRPAVAVDVFAVLAPAVVFVVLLTVCARCCYCCCYFCFTSVVVVDVIFSWVLSYLLQIKRDLDQFVSEKISLVAELDDRKVLLDSTQIQMQVQGSTVYCSSVRQFITVEYTVQVIELCST